MLTETRPATGLRSAFHGVLNAGRCPYSAHFTDGRTKADQIKKEGEKKGTGEGTKRENRRGRNREEAEIA